MTERNNLRAVAPSETVEDYTPASKEEALAWCRRILDRLHHVELVEVVEAEAGVCDDCGGSSSVRWTLGRFTLCRGCAASRRGVATRGS